MDKKKQHSDPSSEPTMTMTTGGWSIHNLHFAPPSLTLIISREEAALPYEYSHMSTLSPSNTIKAGVYYGNTH
jgi:hypothetical protein